MSIEKLNTCHGQTIVPGSQIAYQTEASMRGEGIMGELIVHFTPGHMKVGKVVEIVEESPGFAEADGVYKLKLDNGDVADADQCVVTDGTFVYSR